MRVKNDTIEQFGPPHVDTSTVGPMQDGLGGPELQSVMGCTRLVTDIDQTLTLDRKREQMELLEVENAELRRDLLSAQRRVQQLETLLERYTEKDISMDNSKPPSRPPSKVARREAAGSPFNAPVSNVGPAATRPNVSPTPPPQAGATGEPIDQGSDRNAAHQDEDDAMTGEGGYYQDEQADQATEFAGPSGDSVASLGFAPPRAPAARRGSVGFRNAIGALAGMRNASPDRKPAESAGL